MKPNSQSNTILNDRKKANEQKKNNKSIGLIRQTRNLGYKIGITQ
jgi:hypothetical protein